MTGTVYDRTGGAVVGATVTISGPVMPAARTTVTSEKGAFGFLVLPGEYQAVVEKAGVGHVSGTIIVSTDRETTANFILGAVVAAPVSVVAPAAPEIDVKSTEVRSTVPTWA